MGNVNKGCTQLLVDLRDFSSHLCTQFCVQVRKRFVQQEDLRIPDDCTTHGNTLSLTTGHSLRLPVEEVAQVEDLCSFLYLAVDFILRNFSQLQTECHVLVNGHVRIQSVVLEYHCDISVLRSDIIYQTVADVQFALRDFFQTSDHTQGCGLTTSGRANQNDKFLILNFNINILYRSNIARVNFVDVSQ